MYQRGWDLILRPGEEWWGSQHATVGTGGQLLPARTFSFCNEEREKSQFYVALWLIISIYTYWNPTSLLVLFLFQHMWKVTHIVTRNLKELRLWFAGCDATQ